MTQSGQSHDPLLFGADGCEGLVAVEHVEGKALDQMHCYFRRDGKTVIEKEPFHPFMVVREDVCALLPDDVDVRPLQEPGVLTRLVLFPSWRAWRKTKTRLSKEIGCAPGSPFAPYFVFNDPVQQYLVLSGRTLFLGLEFEALRRMQVDIECTTTEGYEFCNAEREGDRIIAIAMADSSGWSAVLSGAEMDEGELLTRFVEVVREQDPDVIEGHNIFNFDLPYIAARAKRYGVKLALGRGGEVPTVRPSRFSAGERTIAYERCMIRGRHVVDTLFLVQLYDIAHRSLGGFGLKEVAIHFGVAAPERTYIAGCDIANVFQEDPDRLLRYVMDDVLETGAISRLLSMSSFTQTQMLPYSYQNVCVRGNATKIDALMIREYLRQASALPLPDEARSFSGGYTDMFVQGVVENVHHCDIRSLYPSLMLTRKLAPRNDTKGVFLKSLDRLRDVRLDAKARMLESKDERERLYFDALQGTFKILINSFYGYLGFSQARFSDFTAAESVTADGRALLKQMIEWLNVQGARPVEIDTDGIYFVPPEGEQQAFREAFAASLPDGIEIEFDGDYRTMYSYKMKNYALLGHDGKMVLKGAALKSRGLEPFQREFLKELVRLKLEGTEAGIRDLKARYDTAIRTQAWPIERLAKTETLQDSPAAYAARLAKGKRSRNAAYELALASERDYRAGDQLSYYVTGAKKSVTVAEAARLVSEWDPEKRDENISYYLAKLDALYKKFEDVGEQFELAL